VKGVFVTGTDTGAGKTYVSLCLIAGWRAKGLKVGVMKPCETGWPAEQMGAGEVESAGGCPPTDAKLLLEASGSSITLDEVCPYRFSAPMAPAEAAALEGKEISTERIAEAYSSIASKHDITLVEGAGGLLVPFTSKMLMADLVRFLDLPLVIAARAGLGTINHTCLTVEAARARGLDILGVVFTRTDDPAVNPPGPDETGNPDAVARICGVKVIATLPYSKAIPGVDL